MNESVGHWAALVAGRPTGVDRTGLGVALYDPSGKLARFKIDTLARAIARGDLPPGTDLRENRVWVPETYEELLRVTRSYEHATSSIRWDDPLPALAWGERALRRLYGLVTDREGC